jgi:RNA polymerase sigma-70 factor (ECF subfamily)
MWNEADHALIRRVAARDRDAFEALYRTHAPRVQRYLARLLRRPEVVEEVLDDVMVVVWQKADRFDGTSRLSTWILGIAHNKALKSLSGRFRRESERSLDETPAAAVEDEAQGPEATALQGELRNTVEQAVALLPAEQRAVVELTFGQGRSYQEIAGIVGCPVNTVKTRMFHARRRLGRLLATVGIGQLRSKEAAT